jgi:HK97 gp10 family phage protein
MAYVPNNRTIKLEGFAELEQQLLQLAKAYRADAVARNTLVKAAERAMVPVLLAATSKAPFDENNTDGIHMKYTIRLDARIPNGRDLMSDYVRETDAAIAVVSVKKSAVSLAQEFGNSRTPAQPFMRPALDYGAEKVVGILKTELAQAIPAYAQKISRMRKK